MTLNFDECELIRRCRFPRHLTVELNQSLSPFFESKTNRSHAIGPNSSALALTLIFLCNWVFIHATYKQVLGCLERNSTVTEKYNDFYVGVSLQHGNYFTGYIIYKNYIWVA